MNKQHASPENSMSNLIAYAQAAMPDKAHVSNTMPNAEFQRPSKQLWSNSLHSLKQWVFTLKLLFSLNQLSSSSHKPSTHPTVFSPLIVSAHLEIWHLHIAFLPSLQSYVSEIVLFGRVLCVNADGFHFWAALEDFSERWNWSHPRQWRSCHTGQVGWQKHLWLGKNHTAVRFKNW